MQIPAFPNLSHFRKSFLLFFVNLSCKSFLSGGRPDVEFWNTGERPARVVTSSEPVPRAAGMSRQDQWDWAALAQADWNYWICKSGETDFRGFRV